MQHIVLITTSYPGGTPGSEAAGSFVEDFARELAKHCRVTVVAPALEDAVNGTDRLRAVRFAVPALPLSNLNPFRLGDIRAILATLRAGENTLSTLVREQQVDHVLALWALPSGYWARRVCTRRDIPYSTWALGSDIWSLGRLPGVRQILGRVLRDAHSRFADGLELCRAVEGLCAGDCHFMPSTRDFPVAADHRPAQHAPYRLACLGRWHRNKGMDLLLESLSILEDEHWKKIAEVRIHGGGPMEERILQATAQLQQAGRPVQAGGYLDKNGAAALIRNADYLLIPSRIESIPVIFSDAMKSGTPVITTPVGDLPALVNRYHCGVVAAQTSAAGFARAMGEALNTPAASFGAGIELACRDFDLDIIVRQFLEHTTETNAVDV